MLYATVLYTDGERELLEVFDNEEEAKRDARAYLKRWCSDDPDMQITCFSTNTDPDSIEDFADIKGKELWSMTCDDVTASKKVRKFSIKASNRYAKRKVMASMSDDELYRRLREVFADMDDEDKVYVWNEYCREVRDDISEIYPMDEFDEMAENMTPSDIARSIFYGGGFNPNDKYVGYTGYGNFVSFNSLDDDNARYYEDDLISYIMNRNTDFMNVAIGEVLEEYNSDDEDYED